MTQTATGPPSHPHRRQNRQPALLYILFKPGAGAARLQAALVAGDPYEEVGCTHVAN